MAKAKQKGLVTSEGPIEDQVPEAVQDAADVYAKALTAANKAKAKFNGAKDALIDTMIDNTVSRVKVQTDRGEKWVELVDDHKVKMKKVSDPVDEDEDD